MATRPHWYLKPAKKQNLEWTAEAREKIFDLNKQGKSAKEIIAILGLPSDTKATVIYNQVRLYRGAKFGRCFKCRAKLTQAERVSHKPGRQLFLCTKCKNKIKKYKKQKRAEHLKAGRCGVCWKRPALEGKTACAKCLSATHRRRIAKGLCGDCGKRPIDKDRSTSMCTECLNTKAGYSTLLREGGIK